MNSVVLIGRLTRDPEVRYTNSQLAVATFTLAVDRPMAKEKTADFIRITTFGKSAELCERFLSKGRLCGVQGRIQTGSYQTQNGETRYTTEVYADRVEFLDRADGSRGNGGESYGANYGGQSNFGGGSSRPVSQVPEGFSALEDDDDIPF